MGISTIKACCELSVCHSSDISITSTEESYPKLPTKPWLWPELAAEFDLVVANSFTKNIPERRILFLRVEPVIAESPNIDQSLYYAK